MGMIALQHFLRLYQKLAGMTGTAVVPLFTFRKLFSRLKHPQK